MSEFERDYYLTMWQHAIGAISREAAIEILEELIKKVGEPIS